MNNNDVFSKMDSYDVANSVMDESMRSPTVNSPYKKLAFTHGTDGVSGGSQKSIQKMSKRRQSVVNGQEDNSQNGFNVIKEEDRR